MTKRQAPPDLALESSQQHHTQTAHCNTTDGIADAVTRGLNIESLLEILGYRGGEHLSICRRPVGGEFTPHVTECNAVAVHVHAIDEADVWFGVNPVHPDATGRGSATDVTRLAALYLDLDVKDGSCPTIDVAHQIINELAAMIGTRPSAIVETGHGLHPYWPVDDGRIGEEFTTMQAAALLRRWGHLVRLVAGGHGVEVDSVFDLARILRVPGTVNYKADPVPVIGHRDTGGPITVERINEVLDEYGVTDAEAATAAEVVAAADGWTYAESTCAYVKTMTTGWQSDNPPARHPWMLSQCVRLAAAHRNGCLTGPDHLAAITALEARFRALCARPGDARHVPREEVPAVLREGVLRASCKTDADLAGELGRHVHSEPVNGAEANDLLLQMAGLNKAKEHNAIVGGEHQQEAPAEPRRALFTDLRAIYEGGPQERPKPEILTNVDGDSIFYRGKYSTLDGDPESGKTWVSFAAIVEELNAGGRCAFVDMDDNGDQEVMTHLINLGADVDKVLDPQCFRYFDPEDAQHLGEFVAYCETWKPTLVVLDCVTRLMALHQSSNNSADEYLAVFAQVIKPLLKVGAAVIGIDHLAKSEDSRQFGSGGTGQKLASISGVAIRVTPVEQMTPGKGGRLRLIGWKDRKGGLRRRCPRMPKGKFDVGHLYFVVTEGDAMEAVPEPPGDGQMELGHSACGPLRDTDREFLPAAERLTEDKGGYGFTARELAKTHYRVLDPSKAQMCEVGRVVNRMVTSKYLMCIHEGTRSAQNPSRYGTADEG